MVGRENYSTCKITLLDLDGIYTSTDENETSKLVNCGKDRNAKNNFKIFVLSLCEAENMASSLTNTRMSFVDWFGKPIWIRKCAENFLL